MALLALFVSAPGRAHDPIFALGPHVLYKGGVEVATGFRTDDQGDERDTEAGLEVTYGITGDWSAGIELPYTWREDDLTSAHGFGDLAMFTKYRFWRYDTLGAQESAGVLFKLVTNTGDEIGTHPLGSGATDAILGLTYGYEGRRWYRWASVRYRRNGESHAGWRRGDRIFFDLVGGIRLKQTGYVEADTVWIVELNGEYAGNAELNGVELSNSGGTEWFLSPGIFWTKRNFAIKAGIQIPIARDLNGAQEKTDYRTKLVLEWHL